jgi:hypothetical protein
VLSAEVTPHLAPADWTFRIDGLVSEERTWSWEEAHALPRSVYARQLPGRRDQGRVAFTRQGPGRRVPPLAHEGRRPGQAKARRSQRATRRAPLENGLGARSVLGRAAWRPPEGKQSRVTWVR